MFRVLVPTDTDEKRAIAAAEAVSNLPNSEDTVHATILNVQEDVEYRDDTVVKSEDWYDEENFPQSACKARDILENAGVKVDLRREHGDPAEMIVEVAHEISADRIVMAGRKRSPAGKALFGSVTQSVLLNSNIPVTVITKR